MNLRRRATRATAFALATAVVALGVCLWFAFDSLDHSPFPSRFDEQRRLGWDSEVERRGLVRVTEWDRRIQYAKPELGGIPFLDVFRPWPEQAHSSKPLSNDQVIAEIVRFDERGFPAGRVVETPLITVVAELHVVSHDVAPNPVFSHLDLRWLRVLALMAAAAIGFALVESGRIASRRRRWSAGRCVHCGYDLNGLTMCPECGRHRLPPTVAASKSRAVER